MGADIHAVMQKNINDEWITLSEVPIMRDYPLFRAMGYSGREGLKPFKKARGLPSDLEPLKTGNTFIPFNHWDEFDGFSNKFWLGDSGYSWLSGPELIQLNSYLESFGITKHSLRTHIRAMVEEYEKGLFRLVYGFDN